MLLKSNFLLFMHADTLAIVAIYNHLITIQLSPAFPSLY